MMLWYINEEECIFDTWEQLGFALRDLTKHGYEIKIKAGPVCTECNGEGHIVAFTKNGTNIHMECAECSAMGIKH